MTSRASRGFTIIETLLFLAITGVLLAAVMITVSVGLNNQRYRDAVQSFVSVLQDQYADMSSITNSRSNEVGCNTNAAINDAVPENRGQSNCVLAGKYLQVDGANISVYSVVAYEVSKVVRANDIAGLQQNYRYGIVNNDGTDFLAVENSTLEWGTYISRPGTDQARQFRMLVLRSPQSGNVYTFTGNDLPSAINNASLKSLIVPGNTIPGQGGNRVCIESLGMFAQGDMAVFVTPFAANAGAIETLTNSNGAGC